MDYCAPRGIPHSVFLGRVVRPNRDPLWLDTDRDLALAWQVNDRSTCKTCGTRHDEWEPKLGGDRDAYVGATHYCRGDDVLAMQHEVLPKDASGRAKPGFRAYLMPRARLEHELAGEIAALDPPHSD